MRFKWPRNRLFSRLILIIGGLIIGLLIVEGGLRLYEVAGSNRLNRDLMGRDQLITDEKLGLRVMPDAPGHDARGFRNDAVPGQADIVAIGDSQPQYNKTYIARGSMLLGFGSLYILR